MNFAGWFMLAAAVCDSESRALQAAFGAGVKLIGFSPCSVQGDFNGDGVADTAWVVITSGALKAGVRAENPWKLSKSTGPRGLAVALSGVRGNSTSCPMATIFPRRSGSIRIR